MLTGGDVRDGGSGHATGSREVARAHASISVQRQTEPDRSRTTGNGKSLWRRVHWLMVGAVTPNRSAISCDPTRSVGSTSPATAPKGSAR